MEKLYVKLITCIVMNIDVLFRSQKVKRGNNNNGWV